MNAVTEIMNETVSYGGLLVSRYDMYRHLKDVGVIRTGVASPAEFRYMSHQALDARPEWTYDQGVWFNMTTGEVLP